MEKISFTTGAESFTIFYQKKFESRTHGTKYRAIMVIYKFGQRENNSPCTCVYLLLLNNGRAKALPVGGAFAVGKTLKMV